MLYYSQHVERRRFELPTSSVREIKTGSWAPASHQPKPHLTCSHAATASHDERCRTSVRPTVDGLLTDSAWEVGNGAAGNHKTGGDRWLAVPRHNGECRPGVVSLGVGTSLCPRPGTQRRCQRRPSNGNAGRPARGRSDEG